MSPSRPRFSATSSADFPGSSHPLHPCCTLVQVRCWVLQPATICSLRDVGQMFTGGQEGRHMLKAVGFAAICATALFAAFAPVKAQSSNNPYHVDYNWDKIQGRKIGVASA